MPTLPATLPTTTTEKQTEDALTPLYHLVLLDDDEHSYEYVIDMLQKLFHSRKPLLLRLIVGPCVI